MQEFRGTLGDEIWRRLKDWAKDRAGVEEALSHDDCRAQVVRIIREITGHADLLRADLVAFYASEVAEMVEKMGGTIALRNDDRSPDEPTLEPA
jgi:hypothetical protein